jgi:hypothetical protein
MCIKSYSVTVKNIVIFLKIQFLKKPVGERTRTNFINNFSFLIAVVTGTAQRAFAPLVHSRDLRKKMAKKFFWTAIKSKNRTHE